MESNKKWIENKNKESGLRQLSYKPKFKSSELLAISTSVSAYNVLHSVWDEGKIDFLEQFKIILLNRANKVLGILDIQVLDHLIISSQILISIIPHKTHPTLHPVPGRIIYIEKQSAASWKYISSYHQSSPMLPLA